MADKEEKKKKKEAAKAAKKEAKEAKAQEKKAKNEDKDSTASDKEPSQEGSARIGLVTWIIAITIVITLSGSGFILGRLIAKPSSPDTAEISQEDVAKQNVPAENSESDSESKWYYPLDPVVANLDVPGVTRYVRASLRMEISSGWDKVKGEAILEEKKFPLKNWLAIYLASLTLEDARGDRNLRRIQAQILDAFNEILFPNATPQIKQILFESFSIQ